MCNLYQNKSTSAEVASLFGVAAPNIAQFNTPTEIYPGYPGMVVRPADGGRRIEAMTWGFPRVMRSKRTGRPLKPKPVNNARDDKLMTPFWRSSFEKRRCLIPLTAWAEAEGETGRMTCTWYSLAGAELFAVGGIWRWSEEWGDVYSMVMVDGCEQMSDVHDRMPVLLRPEHYDQWMLGSPDDAMALVRTCGDALAVNRTSDLWGKPRKPAEPGPLL